MNARMCTLGSRFEVAQQDGLDSEAEARGGSRISLRVPWDDFRSVEFAVPIREFPIRPVAVQNCGGPKPQTQTNKRAVVEQRRRQLDGGWALAELSDARPSQPTASTIVSMILAEMN
jgi:hypothetical protein